MVFLRGRENAVNLCFDDYMSAIRARDRLSNSTEPVCETTDDIGHALTVRMDEIVGLLVTDVQREIETQAEIALLQAREQAKAQTKANHDPAVRFANAARGSGLIG